MYIYKRNKTKERAKPRPKRRGGVAKDPTNESHKRGCTYALRKVSRRDFSVLDKREKNVGISPNHKKTLHRTSNVFSEKQKTKHPEKCTQNNKREK